MSTTSQPALTELAEQVESIHADLEQVLERAQSVLHHHFESLDTCADLNEDSFVDLCEKDGYLAFVEALGKLQSVTRELDARAFAERLASSRELAGRRQLAS